MIMKCQPLSSEIVKNQNILLINVLSQINHDLWDRTEGIVVEIWNQSHSGHAFSLFDNNLLWKWWDMQNYQLYALNSSFVMHQKFKCNDHILFKRNVPKSIIFIDKYQHYRMDKSFNRRTFWCGFTQRIGNKSTIRHLSTRPDQLLYR